MTLAADGSTFLAGNHFLELLMETANESVSGPAASSIQVEAHGAVTETSATARTATRVIVAVHGVGDQSQFATIQSVVGQFCRRYDAPPATPLGSFHGGAGTFTFPPPGPAPELTELAFAEVYWAKFPRDMVSDRHTLEEAKQWASTIVERLRLRWRQSKARGDGSSYKSGDGPVCREADFKLLRRVLGEMIESVSVLERLCYLGDRAGLFTFDLRRLLEDYLGDVQVVAEFSDTRTKILDTFAKVLEQAHGQYPKAEIHIIAHSEGTVVAFLGLLEAFRHATVPPWTRKVRGLMTIGSPIDKHLMLWPELFAGGPPNLSEELAEKIEWRNYYDRGDPIGFELDDARTWLDGPWSRIFHFEAEHDIGFTRYPFPGKAHVDYWEDDAVFAHFIDTVVKPNGPRTPTAAAPVPGDDRLNKWASYVLPYVGVALLLFLAVYFPFSAIVDYAKAPDPGMGQTARDIGGLASLIFGITVAARVPRLTRVVFWRVVGWAVFLVFLAAGLSLISIRWSSEARIDFSLDRANAMLTAALSISLVLLSRVLSAARPSWGIKPMIVLGALSFMGMAVHLLPSSFNTADAKLWPVVLSLLAFAYLWWLAALIFDLVFVWHVHIRQSTAMKRLRSILKKPPSSSVDPPRSTAAVAS
jgi:hypothetical protein